MKGGFLLIELAVAMALFIISVTVIMHLLSVVIQDSTFYAWRMSMFNQLNNVLELRGQQSRSSKVVVTSSEVGFVYKPVGVGRTTVVGFTSVPLKIKRVCVRDQQKKYEGLFEGVVVS